MFSSAPDTHLCLAWEVVAAAGSAPTCLAGQWILLFRRSFLPSPCNVVRSTGV